MVNKLNQEKIQTISFKNEYKTISGIGIIHGLASNDELLLFLTLTLGLDSLLTIFGGLAIFTLGVVLGMISYGVLLRIPFAKYGQERVMRVVNLTIAGLTLIYAFFMIFGGDTVNLLPLIGSNLNRGLYVIALILGIKHSMDADHVFAISSILLRAESSKKTVFLSIAWAMGHMLTASIITLILYSFKQVILSKILVHFEIVVAFMLIAIAVFTILWEFNIISWGKHTHSHPHEHDVSPDPTHVHSHGHVDATHEHSHSAPSQIE